MTLSFWCDRVIRGGYYLLFALVPLLLTPVNYELFEYNKMMAVYGITVVVTVAWLVKMISAGEVRIAKTPLDIPIVLYLGSQLVSSLFSIDPHVSWFGYYSRFNGGMWSVISYVLLYYAFVSNVDRVISDKRDFSLFTFHFSLLKVALATGSVVALYGVAERLGIDKHLWVQDVQNRVFSTLGQPNWLAAYLVALIPLASGFGLKAQFPNHNDQQGKKTFYWSLGFVIWTLTAALFFLVLLFTRSRSGLLGFAVADLVFWGLVLFGSSRLPKQNQGTALKRVGVPFFLLHFSFFLIVFLNGTHIDAVDRWATLGAWKSRLSSTAQPADHSAVTNEATASGYVAPLLESGGTESGKIRRYVWQGAISAWRSSTKTMLIGTGTETFAFAFYQFKPKGHNLTSEWDFLYNKAHNEYLNYLTTTGVLGLGSYLLFFGSFVLWFVKVQMSKLKAQSNVKAQSSKNSLDFGFDWKFDIWILELSLFAAWLSILVTNFFGFSVVVTQLFLFLFPAIIIAGNIRSDQHAVLVSLPFLASTHKRRIAAFIVMVAGLVIATRIGLLWYADTLFASGYRASRIDSYVQAADNIERAIALNPGEPLYYDEAGSALAGLAILAIEQKDATGAAAFIKQSVRASDTAITISPNNVNFWKTRTKIYYTFSAFEHAQKLSPADPKIPYNLAILTGRNGQNDRSIELLKHTIDLKQNYRDAYYALWVFYKEIKKPELGRAILADYLTKVDPADKDFQERMNE